MGVGGCIIYMHSDTAREHILGVLAEDARLEHQEDLMVAGRLLLECLPHRLHDDVIELLSQGDATALGQVRELVLQVG